MDAPFSPLTCTFVTGTFDISPNRWVPRPMALRRMGPARPSLLTRDGAIRRENSLKLARFPDVAIGMVRVTVRRRGHG